MTAVVAKKVAANMFQKFNLKNIKPAKYMFFTGKGGVGKTSLSSSLAINLADTEKSVLLVSTDPASNLQDIFKTTIGNKPQSVKQVPNLYIINLDPEQAAKEYRESVLSSYRGLLPDSAIANMEEQLSGSCTTEIAAFNEFSSLLVDEKIKNKFDHIIFDTAPTGHTLRMLELPAAWNGYIEHTGGNASCLGQLSGLTDKKQVYENAAKTLKDKKHTTLYLITRPQKIAVDEVVRTARELAELNITNQVVVFNYVLESCIKGDKLSKSFFDNQQAVLNNLPKELVAVEKFMSYLKPYNIVGIDNIRHLITEQKSMPQQVFKNTKLKSKTKSLQNLIEDLLKSNKKVIFTMGKGGVGKTTIACEIAKGIASTGAKVHLTTTDPAAHLKHFIKGDKNLRVSEINPKIEIERYQKQILTEASKIMTKARIDYIKEDLMSPCTEEIAVFKAFADIVASAGEEIVVIDTAPTGHTLLLLDTTQSYARETERASKKQETSIAKLLPRLRDKNFTEIIIVTLAEATPYFESIRLQNDLKRAGITSDTFVINNVMAMHETKDEILKTRGQAEIEWIKKIAKQIQNIYVAEYKL